MSGRRRLIPSYRIHKPSGQAVVTLRDVCGRRRDVYLGVYNSEASRSRYLQVLAEFLSQAPVLISAPTPNSTDERVTPASPATSTSNLSINGLILSFYQHAEGYYRTAKGEPTSELSDYRYSLRPLKVLYGETLAEEFGPRRLKALRQHMIGLGWCRGVINQRVGRIKRMFKWATSEELIRPEVFQALKSVEGLHRGRSEARETDPVKPVAQGHIDAILPFVSSQVRGMIELQRLTGMRPAEVCSLRVCDIDRSGETWTYNPLHHKNVWRGKVRSVALGPRAQAIINHYWGSDSMQFLFSPARERAERYERLRKMRKSKVQPSQFSRTNTTGSRLPGEQYTPASYCRAIARAIKKANEQLWLEGSETNSHELLTLGPIPAWTPNQLRHTRGTEVRQQYGLEAAQVILGHANARITEVYAKRDLALAEKVARETG